MRDGAALLAGARCPACGYVAAAARPRCPECAAALEETLFGPGARVWASTVVRVPVAGRVPPYGLAYVDVDDGPRVLAHAPGDVPLEVGSRVRLAGLTAEGDIRVEPA